MDFDETKKIEVEVSENQFVENRVLVPKRSGFKSRGALRGRNIDLLDIAIIPVVLGVFVSLGFLFANLAKVTSLTTAASDIVSMVTSVF